MKFGEIAELRRESIQPTRFNEYRNYLGYESIAPNSLHITQWDTPKSVSSAKLAFHPNDTIYGRLRPYFRKVVWTQSNYGICSSDFWVFKPKNGIDPRFLFYVAALPEFTNIASASSTGTRMPRANWEAISEYEITDFTYEQQKAIGEFLGRFDDKIESNQAVVTGAEQLIDEIAEQKATDLPTVALSEVCSLSKSTWKPDTSSDQTVHLFSLPAFDEGAVPEQAAVSTIKSNKTLVDRPGILVSRLNPRISRMWWVETDATPVSVCSPEFAYLTAGDMHGLACTWLAVRSPEFRGEIVDRVTGTSGSHQRVRPADLMTIGVPDYRSLAEHTQMTVLTLLHLVSARRQQSAALAELRDALLPELMSGRMRVDEAGCLVSEALDEEVADV